MPRVGLNVDNPYKRSAVRGMESDIQKNAVATLMYHCGTSIKAQCNFGGTSGAPALVTNALVSYFDYDSTILLKVRELYNDIEWENLLRTQLDNRQPVFYSGSNESSGHAFVCDGYFHFNWGWGGYADGYFLTSALSNEK